MIEKKADKAILEEREKKIGSVFGLNVTRSQLVPFCKAVVALFPSLNLGNDKIVNVVSTLIGLSNTCTHYDMIISF